MLAIENVLSPSIRNLFSVFLKMDVGVTNGSSLPLLKMNAFHSFKKRLSENILLPRVGRRQHQTACQLWKRNEPWKQTECRNRLLRFRAEDRSIPSRPWRRRAAEIFRQAEKWLSPSWLLHRCSIPGLCVAMWPGTADMTHGKCGQRELPKVHTSLHWFYVFTCDIRWTQADAEQNSLVWHKNNSLTPSGQLELAQWAYVRGAICIIVHPCFGAHTRISKPSLTVWSMQKKVVAFIPNLLQLCRSYSGFMNVQTRQDDLLPFAALSSSSVSISTYLTSASLST